MRGETNYLICVFKTFMFLNSVWAKAVFCYVLFLAEPSEGSGAFDTTGGGGEKLERGVHAGCYQCLT